MRRGRKNRERGEVEENNRYSIWHGWKGSKQKDGEGHLSQNHQRVCTTADLTAIHNTHAPIMDTWNKGNFFTKDLCL
jgi:hypothetical protein